MIHKLLAGKGKMKRGLSLLLCLALLGSSVISSNVTAEAESDATTVETVETSETEEESISEAVVVNEELTSQEAVSDTTETTEETGADVTETPAENMTEEVTDEATEAVETTEDDSEETTTEQSAEENTTVSEGTENEETVYTGTVTMDNSTLVTVEASAKAGTFPEDTTMSVTLLNEGDEDVKNALDKSGVEYDGYVSLDISFYDVNGMEVEPENGSVSVEISMDAALLGDDVDASSLEVHHLTETSSGLEVETVADTADVAEGTVETTDKETVVAKFTVESFSSFTITWNNKNNDTTYFSLVIKYVTSDGSDLSGSGSNKDVDIGGNENSEKKYTFSDYASDVSGMYSYVEARLGSTDGSVVTTATFSESGNYYAGYIRSLTFDDGTEYTYSDSTKTVNVYLVYEEVTTIETVDSLSNGININLFDYEQTTVNNVTGSAFYFGGSNGSETTTPWNYWKSGYGAYQGIVASTLSNGYPVLAETSKVGTSLSYLFGTTNNSASTTKTGLNHLFSQDVYDATGYYEYNAATNFATIADDDDSNFTVYSSQYNPSATGASDPKFLPFNTLSNINKLGESDEDYYFGMTIDFSFIQPKDGVATWTNTTTGETTSSAMVFEFTGDDDVWVFIDNVLVLDLGGIHDAVSGTIDFSTGIVTVSRLYGETSDSNTTTTLYDLMKKAGKSDDWLAANFTEDKNGNMIFTNYTTHTFNYYYLERGAGGSNCKIRFNLQSIPTGTINFQKELEYANVANASDIEFTFNAYVNYDGTGSSYVLYNGYYEVYDADDNTYTKKRSGNAEEGIITLYDGEVARLISSNILATSRFYIVEVGATSDKYEVSVAGVTVTQSDKTTSTEIAGVTTEMLTVGNNPWIVFKNTVAANNYFDLRIDKEMAEGQSSEDNFSITVLIGGEVYTGAYEVYSSEGALVDNYNATSNGVITLRAGQYALIHELIGGSSIQVYETGLDNVGYLSPSYSIESKSDSLATSSKTSEGVTGTAEEGNALGTNPQIEVVVTNSKKTVNLTIKKVVDGNMGDKAKAFSFSLSNGTTFTLSNGEEETVEVALGTELTLTETQNEGYKVSFTYNNETGTDEILSTGSVSYRFTVAGDNPVIVVENNYDISPDTGFDLDSAPYILMLAGVVALGGVILFRRRRKLL